MALNADGVPLFAGVEDIDDLLITTMQERDKEVVDLITVNHPLFALYKERGWIEYKDQISTHITVKLMDKPNTTVKDFTHYDEADNTPQEALTEARFAYGQTVGVQMYSREELVKNSNSIVDLVDVMADQLDSSMANHFGEKIIGTQDSDGRSIMGIGRVMAYGTSCGNIDPTQAGFAYWNPQRGLKSAGTQYALATEMDAGMQRLVRLCTYNRETPKVWLMGEDLYAAHQSYMRTFLRISTDELKTQLGGKLEDFEMFNYAGRTYIYDQGLGAKVGWLINPKRMPIRIHSGTNFTYEPWQMMEKAVAKKRNCLLYAAVYCKRRNAQGVIEFT